MSLLGVTVLAKSLHVRFHWWEHWGDSYPSWMYGMVFCAAELILQFSRVTGSSLLQVIFMVLSHIKSGKEPAGAAAGKLQLS